MRKSSISTRGVGVKVASLPIGNRVNTPEIQYVSTSKPVSSLLHTTNDTHKGTLDHVAAQNTEGSHKLLHVTDTPVSRQEHDKNTTHSKKPSTSYKILKHLCHNLKKIPINVTRLNSNIYNKSASLIINSVDRYEPIGSSSVAIVGSTGFEYDSNTGMYPLLIPLDNKTWNIDTCLASSIPIALNIRADPFTESETYVPSIHLRLNGEFYSPFRNNPDNICFVYVPDIYRQDHALTFAMIGACLNGQITVYYNMLLPIIPSPSRPTQSDSNAYDSVDDDHIMRDSNTMLLRTSLLNDIRSMSVLSDDNISPELQLENHDTHTSPLDEYACTDELCTIDTQLVTDHNIQASEAVSSPIVATNVEHLSNLVDQLDSVPQLNIEEHTE